MTPFESSLLIALLFGGSAMLFLFALLGIIGLLLTAAERVINLFSKGKK